MHFISVSKVQRDVNCEDDKIEDDIKLERRENEDPDSVVANVHCNETAIGDEKALEEKLECKIEVNDDFDDNFGKEEMNNADPLEDSSDDSEHSPELQGLYF